MTRTQPVLWMGGLLGLGVLALASTSKNRQTVEKAVETAVDDTLDWVKRIVNRTSRHEGTYDSLNLNTDQAGLSFGRLQWSQRTGALGKLLREMHLADPDRFEGIFGPSWSRLLEVTGRGSLEPIDGAVLWSEPWIARFKAAGQVPAFQQVQDRLAAGGEYMHGAIQAARTLGVTSERALSITYDTSVQQGPGAAQSIALTVRRQLEGKTVSTRQLLTQYIQQAAAPFRANQNPGLHKRHPRLTWRQIGNEWHVFAGTVDLYLNIITRRTRLLNAGDLSDTTLSV